MRLNKLSRLASFLIIFFLSGCGVNFSLLSGGNSNLSGLGTVTFDNQQTLTGSNVMKVTVNGSLCGPISQQYRNQPCTSVTICQSGTNNCQTINNILVDTQSVGLRIFTSAISVTLNPVQLQSKNLAECVAFGDGSTQWGQIQTADVILAGEPTVTVPIETINSSYATPPAECTSANSIPETSPAQAGYNGILGVGLFPQDCGELCAKDANPGMYYVCSGSTCTASDAPLALQVQNPVALLPVDNNGVLLDLPPIPSTGARAAEGFLVLGVGTQSNNRPTGVNVYAAGSDAEMTTEFDAFSSTPIPAFIDSGSSLLFLPPPTSGSLPDCSTPAGGGHQSFVGLYCPSSDQPLTAMMIGDSGSAKSTVNFVVGNIFNLFSTYELVFPTAASLSKTGSKAFFDWGLPFFYGRPIYVGIAGTPSNIGTGPYWAY